jgi:hypothetical protein
MNIEDFIFSNILSGCRGSGVRDSVAQGVALRSLDAYRKGQYDGKAAKIITDAIAEAKKQAKASNRK